MLLTSSEYALVQTTKTRGAVDFGGKIKIQFVFEETLTFVEVLEGTPLWNLQL